MAKTLTFIHQNKSFQLEPIKIERKKICGYTLTQYFASDNSECEFTTLTDDGLAIIPKGATAQNILTEQEIAFFRNDLLAFDFQGNPLPKIPSSFDFPIELSQSASMEEYLSLNVNSIYQLLNADDEEIHKLLKDNIFKFSFNYRESYEPNDAFLIYNGKDIFMIVGSIANFEYIGLENIEPELIGNDEADEDFEIDIFRCF